MAISALQCPVDRCLEGIFIDPEVLIRLTKGLIAMTGQAAKVCVRRDSLQLGEKTRPEQETGRDSKKSSLESVLLYQNRKKSVDLLRRDGVLDLFPGGGKIERFAMAFFVAG